MNHSKESSQLAQTSLLIFFSSLSTLCDGGSAGCLLTSSVLLVDSVEQSDSKLLGDSIVFNLGNELNFPATVA